jgi:fatty-acyl-CoA synthase
MYTLPDFARLNARRYPDRVALVDEGGSWTHAELFARASSLARGLIAAGVTPGDRVGVIGGNSAFSIEALLGSAIAAAVFVPYNWRWATDELVAGINLTRPRVVLAERKFIADLELALSAPDLDVDAVICRQGAEYDALFVEGGPVASLIGWDDPLCILFTGGTTGTSKGVVLSHGSAVTNAVNELVDLGFGQGPGNVGLSVTPLFHSASLLCVFVPHYVAGGTNVLMDHFDEARFASLVVEWGVRSTFVIPNMIRRLVAAGSFDLPGVRENLKQLHTGGGLLRMPDKVAVLERMPEVQLFYRYGLTEAGPMLTRLHHNNILDPELDGSIGQEYTFVEVQVQDGEGQELPPGELGEICARGPGMMSGYFGRPDETEATFRGGWLRTGDLASRDEHGYLFFRDRAKDMIKSGGENVYAAEIEQLLYAHPAVLECGVVGVPSIEWDEEVRAVVALRSGFAVGEEELRAYLRGHLAGYKVPKQFHFLASEDMPISTSGKILKSKLREVAGW